jgi:tetratricopeptide (TPR) repeat protein
MTSPIFFLSSRDSSVSQRLRALGATVALSMSSRVTHVLLVKGTDPVPSTLKPVVVISRVADWLARCDAAGGRLLLDAASIAPTETAGKLRSSGGVDSTDHARAVHAVLANREVRLFTSSTFRDMNDERQELMLKALPALRRVASAKGVFVTFVDLRWGVTEEQSRLGETLRTCLREVVRCRPYFLALLGDRYGWAQNADEPHDALLARTFERAAAEPAFAWVKSMADRSMTELEIECALFRAPAGTQPGHQFVYIRDAVSASSESRDAVAKLDALKARVLTGQQLAAVSTFRTPQDLSDRVIADLTAAIERDADAQTLLREPLADELDAQFVFVSERVRAFVINDADFEALDVFVDEPDGGDTDEHVLFVSGERGGGKSALLANWTVRWHQQYDAEALDAAPHDRTLLFEHFLGCSAAGSGLACVVALLARRVSQALGVDAKTLCAPKQRNQLDALADEDGDENELNAAAAVAVGRAADEAPGDAAHGGAADAEADISAAASERDDADAFVEWVNIAAQRFRRVVLVLDGVDLLHGVKQRGAAASLVFLASRFAANVRLITSATPMSNRAAANGGTVCDLLRARATRTLRAAGFASAGGLALDDAGGDAARPSAKAMLCAARLKCAHVSKSLPVACERLLAACAPACASPRYLTLMLDELLATGRFESLEQQLEQLIRDGGGGVRDLCAVLVKRWEQTLSPQLVRDFICFMWMSRDGVSEAELKELLGVRSDLQWVQLLATLGDIVVNHFGLLTFRHQDLKKVVKLRYLNDAKARFGYDRRLSEYFLAQPIAPRAVREAAHHLLYAADGVGAGAAGDASAKAWVDGALRTLTTAVERVALLQRLAPGALVALWRRCETHCVSGADDVLASLLRSMAAVAASDAPLSRVSSLQRAVAALLHDVGQYRAAEELLRAALATDRHLYANAHLVIVRGLCALAQVVERRGDIAGALKHAQAALDLCERLGGNQRAASEPKVLQVCARLEKRLGNYADAKERYVLALRLLDEQAQQRGESAEHSAVVTLELADVERKLGNIDSAERLYSDVLRLLTRACGADSHRLAPVLRCLGLVAKKRGIYDAALKHQSRALQLHQGHFGADHPSCAEYLKDVADVNRKLGRNAVALDLYAQAARLVRRAHGLPADGAAFAHTDDGALELAELEHQQALVYKKLAQYGRAAAMLTHALDVYRHLLPSHSQVGVLARDLADTLRKQDRFADARRFYNEALKVVELTLGKRHEEAADIHNSIGLIDKKQARYSDAERRFRTATAIVKSVYGDEHAKVGTYLANIADVQRKTGDTERAIESYREALRIGEASLGATHVDTIETRVRLARALAASKNAAEVSGALATLAKCVDDLTAQLSATHPKVGETRAINAQMLFEAGRLVDAAAEASLATRVLRDGLGEHSVELGDALATTADIAAARNDLAAAVEAARAAKRIFAAAFATQADDAVQSQQQQQQQQHPKLQAVNRLLEKLGEKN